MTHNIIQTENYLLVVDDSEIKVGEWCYIPFENSIKRYGKYFADDWKKIIAHLPLNNSPILEGVDLLPILEDNEAEKVVYEVCQSECMVDEFGKPTQHGMEVGLAVYEKAKEKYKYTEEDMRKAISMVKKNWNDKVSNEENIIQSLSQPKYPVAFECEEKVSSDSMYVNHVIYKPKTTTNSQGQTVLVGGYIYEQAN